MTVATGKSPRSSRRDDLPSARSLRVTDRRGDAVKARQPRSPDASVGGLFAIMRCISWHWLAPPAEADCQLPLAL